jgi:hypothetical protein
MVERVRQRYVLENIVIANIVYAESILDTLGMNIEKQRMQYFAPGNDRNISLPVTPIKLEERIYKCPKIFLQLVRLAHGSCDSSAGILTGFTHIYNFSITLSYA